MLYQKGTQKIEVIVRKDATESGATEKEVGDKSESVGSNGKKSASDRRRKRIIKV